MVKLIGGLIIILSGVIGGRFMGYQYIERCKELQAFSTALHMLETEIGYGRTLLPAATLRLAEISPEPLQSFFQKFNQYLEAYSGLTADQAWQRVIAETEGNFCLKVEDWDVLRQYGRALGRSNDSDQVRHLKVAQLRLEQLETKAKEESEKMSRLWNYVGTLTSIALVIMLL